LSLFRAPHPHLSWFPSLRLDVAVRVACGHDHATAAAAAAAAAIPLLIAARRKVVHSTAPPAVAQEEVCQLPQPRAPHESRRAAEGAGNEVGTRSRGSK
jgi:hypothetical protein